MPEPNRGWFFWVVRGLLALGALAAPILVYKGFTDERTPDPVKQQRLRESSPPPRAVPRPDADRNVQP